MTAIEGLGRRLLAALAHGPLGRRPARGCTTYTLVIRIDVPRGGTHHIEADVNAMELPVPRIGETLIFDGNLDLDLDVTDIRHWFAIEGHRLELYVGAAGRVNDGLLAKLETGELLERLREFPAVLNVRNAD